MNPPGGVVWSWSQTLEEEKFDSVLSFGITIKILFPAFSWDFLGFSGRFSSKEEVGRGRNTQISTYIPLLCPVLNLICLKHQ